MSSKAAWAVTLMVAAAAVAAAQTVDEFDAWMQAIDEKTQSVQQSITRGDAEAVAADARALQASFKQVEGFWADRADGQDAVALSREARERAEGIERAAAARDFGAASSEAIKVAGTCTACHRLHRPLP